MESDLKNLDLYGILEIQQSATLKEIKTAYRKKALQCHPDKNPNNPEAAKSFLQLTKILSVLTDTSARAAYDKVVNAKIAAKLREKNYDSKRMKFKDDLLKREKEASSRMSDHLNFLFEREMARLRKETSDLLAKEKARVSKLLKEQENEKRTNGSYKLKVKWKKIEVYNKDNLTSLFSKHGDVITIVILERKKCVALVEYKSKISAINAKNLEVGYPNDPLAVSFIGDYGEDTKESYSQNSSSETNDKFIFLNYEATVLERFRQAGKS